MSACALGCDVPGCSAEIAAGASHLACLECDHDVCVRSANILSFLVTPVDFRFELLDSSVRMAASSTALSALVLVGVSAERGGSRYALSRC